MHVVIESSLSWGLIKDICVFSRGANKEQCVELCISCGKQERRCHLLSVTEGSVTEQDGQVTQDVHGIPTYVYVDHVCVHSTSA